MDDQFLPFIETEHARIPVFNYYSFITLTTAGSGYLNFMGNEFGHPEWIDFPREGNNWSCRYARRQWHLADDINLKYHALARFDHDMIELTKQFKLFDSWEPRLLYVHEDHKIIAYERATLIFVFSFHPSLSHTDYCFEVPPGKYQMIFNSDAREYAGGNRLNPNQKHLTFSDASEPVREVISLYLPTRTALVLKPEM